MEMFTIRYHVFADFKQFNRDNTRTTEYYRWYKVPTLEQARRKLREKITDLDESYAVSIDVYGGNARTLREEGRHFSDFLFVQLTPSSFHESFKTQAEAESAIASRTTSSLRSI